MEDGVSEFSDWEVLSAASSPGGDVDGVLVSGDGGGGGGSDVLHDHFALVPGFPAEGSCPEAVSDDDEAVAEEKVGLEFLDRFDSVSPERLDLIAVVDSTAQLQLQFGGIDDETAEEGAALEAAAACGGATWSAEEMHDEVQHGETDHEEEAVHSCGEFDSISQAVVAAEWHDEVLHGEMDHKKEAVQGVEGILDFDATAAADGFQIEISQNSSMQLEDGAADVTTDSSLLEAAATSDVMQGAQEDPEQGKDASTASSCGESDGSSPIVESPAAGKGERQLVVWLRLPFKLLHYCAWKVRPVWSISIAAALLGIVVLGRRMYRMRRKTWGIPQIKIAFDDKRASQFADRAARLNEAFLIAKRVPALRTSSAAVLPWAMVQER